MVFRLSALGDIAILVPVLKSLIKQHQVRIILIAPEFVKPLFKDLNRIELYPISKGLKLPGICDLYKFSRKLNRQPFDYIADCHNVTRTKLLRLFLKTSRLKIAIINKGRKEKKKLIRYPKKNFRQLKPTIERYADVFRSLGFPITIEQPIVEKKLWIENTSSSVRKKKIGIAPFSQHKGKTYPLDLMEKIVDILDPKVIEIFLFGSPNETVLLKKWASKYNVIDTSTSSFDKQVKIIATLDLMVSMDSANGHIATNYGIRVLTIWGMTHPYLGFKPFGQPDDNQILLDRTKFPRIPTSVYGKKIPDNYENAMRTISPFIIAERINKILSLS